jgi:hypothetical protein
MFILNPNFDRNLPILKKQGVAGLLTKVLDKFTLRGLLKKNSSADSARIKPSL